MTSRAPIVAVLLAGGRSSRFGTDKSLAVLGGKTLVARVAERLAPQVDAMVISANGDPIRFAFLGLPVVSDREELGAFSGPLAGILAGIEFARVSCPRAKYVASAATDTPFFPADLVVRLAEAVEGDRPAVARSASGVHPVFGLWPVSVRTALRDAIEREARSARDFARAQGAIEVPFGPETIGAGAIDPFFNINRAEDLQRAALLLQH